MLTAGCAHYPLNARLDHIDRSAGYRLNNLPVDEKADELLVILAFSGGGTRAAAFSYGVMEQLAKTRIHWQGRTRRLLDEVDIISSVSGGSFTAAYYALYGDRIFDDFEQRFLKKDIQGELTKRLFFPPNWLRLASPTFDRIDMAAEYYDANLFDHHTFSDLTRVGRRPFLVMNATDLTLGSRFEFTQDQFDLLNSDLSTFPIARAVAASSAFPGLLTPLTVKNYTTTTNYFEPEWVQNGLRDREISPRRYALAQEILSYREPQKHYIHLLDGGVSDNIGLRGPLHAVASTDSAWSIRPRINLRKTRKVLVIVADAKPETEHRWDSTESAPGLVDVLGVCTFAPMGNYSFETVELVREYFEQWKKDAQAWNDCREILQKHKPDATMPYTSPPQVEYYAVVLDFDGIKDENERRFCKVLPTSFSLPPEAVDHLRENAKTLLVESKAFQKFLKELR